MYKRSVSYLFQIMAMVAASHFWSCEGGTGAGNPATETQITLRLDATNSSPGADTSLYFLDPQGTRFHILEAQAHVRHIEFDLPDGTKCGDVKPQPPLTCDSERITAEGPYFVDLVEGTSVPSLGQIRVPAGNYSRIDVRFAEADGGGGNPVPAGHPLVGNTLVLKATFAYQGKNDRQLSLALKFSEDMRFESDNQLRLLATNAYAVVMKIPVDQWMKNVNFTKCLQDGELKLDASGNLSITDDSVGGGDCGGIENTIKDNLKNSGELSSTLLER